MDLFFLGWLMGLLTVCVMLGIGVILTALFRTIDDHFFNEEHKRMKAMQREANVAWKTAQRM